MNRIKLAQLRDVAIECLPAAQKIFEQDKKWRVNEETHFIHLSHVANTILGNVTTTGVELAAAQLLLELASHKIYDPNSPELKEFDPKELHDLSMKRITVAVKELSKLTGRDMAHLMPADAPAGNVDAGTSPSGGDWEVKARAIADSEALIRYARGEREITARNICDAVATELAKDSTTHGTRGERASGTIRNEALKGWKFIPPTGTNGTSGTKK